MLVLSVVCATTFVSVPIWMYSAGNWNGFVFAGEDAAAVCHRVPLRAAASLADHTALRAAEFTLTAAARAVFTVVFAWWASLERWQMWKERPGLFISAGVAETRASCVLGWPLSLSSPWCGGHRRAGSVDYDRIDHVKQGITLACVLTGVAFCIYFGVVASHVRCSAALRCAAARPVRAPRVGRCVRTESRVDHGP